MPAPKDPATNAAWRAKLSEAGKGKEPWNKGRTGTQVPWEQRQEGDLQPHSGSSRQDERRAEGSRDHTREAREHQRCIDGSQRHLADWASLPRGLYVRTALS